MQKALVENPRMRYQEKLFLNRTGHQNFFKSVTRQKRDNTLLSGFGGIQPILADNDQNQQKISVYKMNEDV